MNKYLKYTLLAILALGAFYAIARVLKTNSKPAELYETEKPSRQNILNRVVATGKVIPQEEVEIKPQVSGIIDKIYLEEGAQVKAGDLIAVIRVVPNEQSLNQAQGRVRSAEIALNTIKLEFDRNKVLHDKGVISDQEFNNQQRQIQQAQQELENARADYQIIRLGSAGGSSSANTNIRATVTGTILEIPVEEGDQVIQSNNFNDGTTIATIADLGKMIFEGKVDEAEVGKLRMGMPLTITLGAIQEKEFEADLKFIAPKGVEEDGAVQFKIEGDVSLDESFFIRAGYSANASLVLEEKDSVLAIKEAWLQFDKETEKPYVEVKTGENTYERRDLETGISDGIFVEILSGVTEEDEIKVWNKTEPIEDDQPRRGND